MEVLYIPQLDEVSVTGETAATRYRLAGRVPEAGVVALADKTITRVRADDATPITFVVPPAVDGQARDFFLRIVVTTAEVPEITIAPPTGESVTFEGLEDGVLSLRSGVNILAFTEAEQGVFFIARRQTDIVKSVSFDTHGGSSVVSPRSYKVGKRYLYLPKTSFEDHTFAGWFTAATGGTKVTENDCVLYDVDRLHAQWTDYVDIFVNNICPAKDLRFYTGSDTAWTIDVDGISADTTPAARSGAISHDETSTLWTYVEGSGTIAFKWRSSSEQTFDKLSVLVDGVVKASISGWKLRYEQCSIAVTGAGRHKVEWVYSKDDMVSENDDCGWIDVVRWTPEAT